MSDVTSRLTLNVRLTGLRVFRVRLWLGLQLVKLAAAVMGVGIHVDLEKDTTPSWRNRDGSLKENRL